jgi:hypothetical protein
MKPQAVMVTALDRCSGTTRQQAPCRGHARYACVCGRRWCGTHVVRTSLGLRCPACNRDVTPN